MIPLSSPAMMPFTTAHFVLAIDSLASVSFSTCVGLAGEVSVEEYSEGGENRFAHRFPTRVSHPNLVLGQGAGPTRELWDWFAEFQLTGLVQPRDGTVTLMAAIDGAMIPARVWSFQRGWPATLTGPELDAQSSAVAIDSIEIAHHGLHLSKGI